MTTATRPTTDPTESTHRRPESDRGTWELDRARCAVGIELALPGATIWRARLRPRTAHLTQSDRGSHGTGDGIGLTASLMAGPTLASLPLTRALFLRGTPRTASISVEADGELGGAEHDDGGPGAVGLIGLVGEVTVARRRWPAQFALRRTPIGEERLLVVLAGRLVRPVRTFPGTEIRIEAVAEFVRCD